VTEPFLDLGNVCVVRQRIGGGRGSQGMHTEAVDIDIDAGFLSRVLQAARCGRVSSVPFTGRG